MELGKKKEVKKRTKAGGKSLSQKYVLFVVWRAVYGCLLRLVCRMLHWYDLDTKSKKAQGVMVLKHMFTLDEVKADPTLLYDLKEYACIYDSHPSIRLTWAHVEMLARNAQSLGPSRNWRSLT